MIHASRFSRSFASHAAPRVRQAEGAVEIVQYGDFECKECGRVANSLQALRHRSEGAVNFVWKHFPSATLHRHALQAAEAAECARAQGHFWPMHNLLVMNQERLDLRSLYDYAAALGLDMDQFTTEMDEEIHLPTIRNHIYNGTLAGVRRTPTYFVDGVLVDNNSELRALFDATNQLLRQRRGFGLAVEGTLGG